MSEEKIMILKMLKDGKINEEEALKLLDAVGENKAKKAYNESRSHIHYNDQEREYTDVSERFANKISNFVNKIVNTSLDKAEEGIKNGRSYTVFSFDDGRNLKNKKLATLKLSLDKNTQYNIKIKNNNGKIDILPSSSDQLEVYSKIYYTNKKHVRDNYEFINCFIDNKELIIEPNYADLDKKDFVLSLKVLVPSQTFAKTDITTSNSKINIDSLNTDELSLKTSNAKIRIEDSIVEKTFLKTSNDSIRLKNSKFKNILANTTNAEITLNNTPFVNLEAHTTNAFIDIKDVYNCAENIIATNTNGPVTLDLSNVNRNIKINLRGLNKHTCQAIFDDDRFILNEDSDELTTARLNNNSNLNLSADLKTSNGPIIIE